MIIMVKKCAVIGSGHVKSVQLFSITNAYHLLFASLQKPLIYST